VLLFATIVIGATLLHLNGQKLSADPPLHLVPDGATILIILMLCSFVTGYLSHLLQRLLDTLVSDHRDLELRVTDRTAALSDALSNLRTMQNELVHA
ncbi:hypothetical protein, partial [Enterobacter hormaechei]